MKCSTLKYLLFYCLIMVISGCKSLNTSLSIKSREIPKSYNSQSDTLNTAQIEWRNYFKDTLLIDLIDSAIYSNQDLHIALHKIELARLNVARAKGKILPSVDVVAGGGLRKFGLYTMDGAGNITTEITPGQIVPIHLPDMSLGLSSSWEIDIWGKLKNQRNSSLNQYLASMEGVNFVVSNLVADVASAYFELIALDSEMEILLLSIRSNEEALAAVEAQKATGRATELEIQQMRLALIDAEIRLKEKEQEIVEVENLVNFLLGRYPQPIQRNKGSLKQSGSFSIGTGIPADLLNNRPDIREAEFQVVASKFDLLAAKSAFFPTLNISAAAGFQAFDPQYLFLTPSSAAYSVIGGLVAPVVNRSAIEADFKAAKVSQISAMYHYQKTILNGYIEVVNELARLESLEIINQLRDEQLSLVQKSIDLSLGLYNSNRISFLELLTVQQNNLEVQLESIETLKEQRLSVVKMYKALGGGWR